jgi:hypothetical protein
MEEVKEPTKRPWRLSTNLPPNQLGSHAQEGVHTNRLHAVLDAEQPKDQGLNSGHTPGKQKKS